MQKEPQSNDDLRHAFPSRVQEDAVVAISTFPKNPYWFDCFNALVDNQALSIPYRIYHNSSLVHTDRLGQVQKELVDCLLTRHHDGLIRQAHLTRIVTSRNTWVPPFVVQLLGEYVVQIIRVIEENLGNLDTPVYAEFLQSNPRFLDLTERRVFSYWDCYYRTVKRDAYSGFRVLRFFKELAGRQQ